MGYIIYSQLDPRWAGMQLGTCGHVTIGDAGCYLCALAMGATQLGAVVTPDVLDNFLTRHHLYANGCDMVDSVLQSLSALEPGSTRWLYLGTYEPAAGAFDRAQYHSDANQFAVLGLHAYGHSHFVTVVSWDGTHCLIGDPYTGKVEDLDAKYGQGAVYKLVRYALIPPPPPVVVGPTPEQKFLAGVKQLLHDLNL